MTRDFWTPAEDAQLRALYDEGKSFTEMGKALKRTKNSCISRSRRLKFPQRSDLLLKRHAQRAGRISKAKARNPFRITTHRKTERRPPMYLRVVSAPESKPVPLMERTGCCYPTTAEGPHEFCNAPQSGHSDYCEFHRRLMYRARAA